jgi:3-oxoadipate enol-lactonase
MPSTRASDGTRLHYEALGDGPPVLLIHGLGTDTRGWALQRAAFARRYRTITFDNRGAGRSDKPLGPYSLLQMADDTVAVLDAAGIESAHVIGASMGGVLTQMVATRHPERVRSIVLACTACQNPPWRRELLGEWIDLAAAEGATAVTRETVRWVVGPRSMRRLAPFASLFGGWIGPLGLIRSADGFVAQAEAILAADDDWADELADLRVPALVVVGNQDVLTPRGDSEELAERIPGAELAVIAGGAHGFMIEQWRRFNSVVLEFLDRVSAAERDAASRDGADGAGLGEAALSGR